jgi:Tfp pilus assembly protein PilV
VRASAGRTRGSALVEALVALVLIALAGLIMASAAATALRVAGRAATLSRATALAARELARLANVAATATAGDSTLAVTGFAAPVACVTEVERNGPLASLAVRVDAGRPAEHVVLATRRVLDGVE